MKACLTLALTTAWMLAIERDSRNNINCRRCWVWTTTGKFLMMRWCRLDHQRLLSELLFCFSSFGIEKDKREKKLKTKKTQTNEDASLILMVTHHWWPRLKKIHDRMKLEKKRSTCGRFHQHKDVCDKTDEVAGDNSSWQQWRNRLLNKLMLVLKRTWAYLKPWQADNDDTALKDN